MIFDSLHQLLLTIITKIFSQSYIRIVNLELLLWLSRKTLTAFDILVFVMCKNVSISGRNFELIESFVSDSEMKVILNSYSSRCFPNNAAVSQVSILVIKLFQIFINGLPDYMSTQLGNYTDDTTIYFCFNCQTNRFDKIKLELIEKMT